MCKKQTSVSHSSTESEIISLDAGLRMDGIPALDLWDLVVEVLHSSSNQPKKSKENVRELINLLGNCGVPGSLRKKSELSSQQMARSAECRVHSAQNLHAEAPIKCFSRSDPVGA